MKDDQIERVALNEAFHREVKSLDKQMAEAKTELSQTILQLDELERKRRLAIEKLIGSQDLYLKRIKDLALVHNIDISNTRWNFDCGSMSFMKVPVELAK